jgi:hypothetical protein
VRYLKKAGIECLKKGKEGKRERGKEGKRERGREEGQERSNGGLIHTVKSGISELASALKLDRISHVERPRVSSASHVSFEKSIPSDSQGKVQPYGNPYRHYE